MPPPPPANRTIKKLKETLGAFFTKTVNVSLKEVAMLAGQVAPYSMGTFEGYTPYTPPPIPSPKYFIVRNMKSYTGHYQGRNIIDHGSYKLFSKPNGGPGWNSRTFLDEVNNGGTSGRYLTDITVTYNADSTKTYTISPPAPPGTGFRKQQFYINLIQPYI